jgi:glycosyltransferase involved in cell wall biosynthesis
MRALSDLCIDMELTTFVTPHESKLKRAYGEDISSIIKKIKKVNILQLKKNGISNDESRHYDITINTHGDGAPYYHSSFLKSNTITYCHFPEAELHLQLHLIDYLKGDLKILGLDNSETRHSREYFRMVRNIYQNMMKNSTVLTNSRFSQKAIFDELSIDATVLSPPVDIQTFREAALSSVARENFILVVCRIDRSKKIENAIKLAKLLQTKKIGDGMRIIGNVNYGRDLNYYYYLKQLVMDYDLTDFVKFEINISLDRLLSFMRKAKVYFHTRAGEHFGISIAEAMSAGLIPVVPDTGGHTEFVPRKYQFSTLEEAAEIVEAGLGQSPAERTAVSHLVEKFSIQNYVDSFKQIINRL